MGCSAGERGGKPGSGAVSGWTATPQVPKAAAGACEWAARSLRGRAGQGRRALRVSPPAGRRAVPGAGAVVREKRTGAGGVRAGGDAPRAGAARGPGLRAPGGSRQEFRRPSRCAFCGRQEPRRPGPGPTEGADLALPAFPLALSCTGRGRALSSPRPEWGQGARRGGTCRGRHILLVLAREGSYLKNRP